MWIELLVLHVCVQLLTSANNVTLPASNAERRRAVIDRYLLPAGRTAANLQQRRGRAHDGTDGKTDGRTNR